MTDKAHVATVISAAMKVRAYTPTIAAQKADISRPSLYKIMQGKCNPSTETLYKIARGWDYPDLFADLGMIL